MGPRELGIEGSTDPNPLNTEEWVHHLHDYLADANQLITDLMNFVPNHRVIDYRERQLHIQAALGAADAQWR